MGGRRCEEAPRRRDTPWKNLSYKALINVVPNGVIDSMVNSMRASGFV
jgi:hypothetical protein